MTPEKPKYRLHDEVWNNMRDLAQLDSGIVDLEALESPLWDTLNLICWYEDQEPMRDGFHEKFFEVLNRTIYKNVERMNSDKNLTLCLIDYQQGRLSLSGQHEEMVVVRAGGEVERIDTIDLGFPIGLEETIEDFVFQGVCLCHSYGIENRLHWNVWGHNEMR